MSKSSLLKNARNYAEYLRKKERGPVKAFFHITKNENVPAIEQQGLLTNHPNANVNSVAHPFRKHGTDAGGVWVTTKPTAFPVYGTTIGGKRGNAEARADALSTIKIEIPLPELKKMKAVQDPYGLNILRKGDDPRAVEPFPTWAGIDVPSTVFLDDIKPQWLKNIGYVEDTRAAVPAASHKSIDPNLISWNPSITKGLNKADRQALTGLTGADRKLVKQGIPQFINIDKSPSLPVREQIFKNLPIKDRLPKFPTPTSVDIMAMKQGAYSGPKYELDGIPNIYPAPNEIKRYSADFIPARRWSDDYRDYIKPGESIKNRRQFEFAPGAISRGMGGVRMPPLKERQFHWDAYKQLISEGKTPAYATYIAQPSVTLNWDNIAYRSGQYRPEWMPAKELEAINEGAISRGTPYDMQSSARMNKANRTVASLYIQRAKAEATKDLTSHLGRQPTAKEIDNWARSVVWTDIESGNMGNVPPILNTWAKKADWDMVDRLIDEIDGK